MAENSSNGAWFGAGMGLGVVIGGLFMWAIIRSQQSQGQGTPALQSMGINPQPPPVNIYPVIREEVVHPKVPELPGVIEAPKVQPDAASTTTYKNNEKWEVERGDDGFIKSLNVVRDAKVNAPA